MLESDRRNSVVVLTCRESESVPCFLLFHFILFIFIYFYFIFSFYFYLFIYLFLFIYFFYFFIFFFCCWGGTAPIRLNMTTEVDQNRFWGPINPRRKTLNLQWGRTVDGLTYRSAVDKLNVWYNYFRDLYSVHEKDMFDDWSRSHTCSTGTARYRREC